MKYLKRFKKYSESIQIDARFQEIDLMESLSIWHDVLLASISANEVDIYDVFKLPKENFKENLDIGYLSDNVEFINSLASIRLKKSTVQLTDDYETFVNQPCKFMMIYDMNANELENPEYIIFQTWNESLKKWDDCKLYKVNDNIKKFYDKLSSKTIEIIDGAENYIYTTSNGTEWQLQNVDKENDTYKKVFIKDDLQKLVSDKKVTINII